MFSGIVESKQPIIATKERDQVVEVQIKKPHDFDDLRIGHSICVDGVCLTVESFDDEKMVFALAPETLEVTGWSQGNGLMGRMVNLERSLRVSDRVHGHFVSGHVDSRGQVTAKEDLGESTKFSIEFPQAMAAMIWKKGCIAINGVSLTVNWVESNEFGICLVPETLRQTNLLELQTGSGVNLEADAMARAWLRAFELQRSTESTKGNNEVRA